MDSSNGGGKGIRPKYDMWFLIVLAVIVWSLASQLIGLASLVPTAYFNIGLWARLLATGIALGGAFWIFRMYIRSVKRAAAQGKRVKSVEIFGTEDGNEESQEES